MSDQKQFLSRRDLGLHINSIRQRNTISVRRFNCPSFKLLALIYVSSFVSKKANKSMDCVNLKLLENKSATATTSPSNHRTATNQSQLLRRNQADNTCSHNKNPGTRQCRCFGDVLFRCCELQVKQWSHTLWSLILEHSVSVTLV